MNKAFKTIIKCDNCDFSIEGNPVIWHGKNCPKCGATNIVNDKDIEMLNSISTLAGILPEGAIGAKDGRNIVQTRINSRGCGGQNNDG